MAAAALARRRLREQMKQKELVLNEATLHGPIDFPNSPSLTQALKALLLRLLEREPSRRIATAAEVKEHPYLGSHVEWELLRMQVLPAPYVPSPNLVYAKDIVPALSIHNDAYDNPRLAEDVGVHLGEWGYSLAADSQEFSDELGEYVRKFAAVSRA